MEKENKISLASEKNQTPRRRSLEVTRTFLKSGQNVSRSLWIKVNPQNPLLKLLLVPPAAVLILTMLIFILIF